MRFNSPERTNEDQRGHGGRYHHVGKVERGRLRRNETGCEALNALNPAFALSLTWPRYGVCDKRIQA